MPDLEEEVVRTLVLRRSEVVSVCPAVQGSLVVTRAHTHEVCFDVGDVLALLDTTAEFVRLPTLARPMSDEARLRAYSLIGKSPSAAKPGEMRCG